MPESRQAPLKRDTEHYAKWDPQNRKRTSGPEEAERILKATGKMPRTVRLSNVKLSTVPLKKSIVANAKERRKVAEWVGMYAITRIQAKLLLMRENHEVWGHERVLIYGKILVQWLQPDSNTKDPMEMTHNLKFKAAFREDNDPFLPTKEREWNEYLGRQGFNPDVVEGRDVADAIKNMKGRDKAEVQENMFCEAILDNVVDLGELVLQHFACHLDKQVTAAPKEESRLQRRMERRLSKEIGQKAEIKTKQEMPENDVKVTAQDIHDTASTFNDYNKRPFRFGG